ncbi:MFS transporter [Thalassospira sp. MCCC 1A01428]|uniref:MFS transporter n=1 Tax=Thalassospira sp. MCCC 1A01428 TaxID=1470575 RepID=UPI000A1D987D|nr:MFS transporter [Thalassospira sp. MCCC 1A01428]OSQ46364.1 arabinose transporter permease [Thalassospira sp. MCCC 1A01428]
MPLAIYALAAGAFGIGMTEFVIMGLLLDVARDLDVSLSSSGLLVTGYALGVVVGAPVLTIFTGRWRRKNVLLFLMAVFIIGNFLCAIAPDYATLMMARIIAAFAHGAFFGIGAVVATDLVAREKKASAIAIMFTGLTVANVLGVPFGTWLGQIYGWRATFEAVTVIGVLALIATAFLVPRDKKHTTINVTAEMTALLRPQVLLGLAITVLGFGGVFAAFTYIAPLLTEIAGFSDAAVSPILLLFGVGLFIGNLYGGRLADRRLMVTLIGSLVFLSVVLVVLTYALDNQIFTIITVGVLGAAAFSTVPPLQMRVLAKAEGAPSLASSINIAAFNLGNAGGAWLGGVAIDHGPGLAGVPLVAAAITAGGLVLALISWRMDRSSDGKLASLAA